MEDDERTDRAEDGSGTQPCVRCGHTQDVHTHLRPGHECSLCTCRQYAAPGRRRWWRRR